MVREAVVVKKPHETDGGIETPLRGGFVPPTPAVRVLRERKVVNRLTSALDLVGGMSKAERQELLDRLALEGVISAKSAANRDIEMWSGAVHSALGDAISSGGGENYGVGLVKRSLALPAFWRPVEAFMSASGLQELKVTERQQVYSLLARLLVDHALEVSRRSGAPLSPKLVGSCASNIASVFDQSFPGYAAAGLAHVVARQLAAGAWQK